jgi:2-keto-3-deoxy-L-rhamnonate aldolase RhmA
MRINTVKHALHEGKTMFGCSTSMLRSPEVQRILAAAGLAWTYLDSEHGGFDLETLQDLIRAANDAGLCPIVRVADLQYPLVARALDCGAQGVLFPASNLELLEKAISWTRFRPRACDLVCSRPSGLRPHVEIVAQSREYHGGAADRNPNGAGTDRRTAVRAQNRRGDDRSRGPSISLGVPGQFEHPRW